jgi:prepilin-type N-terminal cleavage/methylation domain-containing protein
MIFQDINNIQKEGRMKLLRNKKGFTLIELIIVIIVLGILAASAVPKFTELQKDAARGVAQGFLGALRGANMIQYATMAMAGSTGVYTWTDVLARMDYQGIDTPTIGGQTITIKVSGFDFQFSMDPQPNVPTGYAGIKTVTGGNW